MVESSRPLWVVGLLGPVWSHVNATLILIIHYLAHSQAEELEIIASAHATFQQRIQNAFEDAVAASAYGAEVKRSILTRFTVHAAHSNSDAQKQGRALEGADKIMVGAELFVDEAQGLIDLLSQLSQQRAPPQLVIIDVFHGVKISDLRAAAPSASVLMWYSAITTALLTIWGPPDIGGEFDAFERAQAIAADPSQNADHQPWQSIFVDRMTNPSDHLVKVPGIPALFQYELSPNRFPNPVMLADLLVGARDNIFAESDGLIINSAPWYERQSSDFWASYYKQRAKGDKEVHFGGHCAILPEPKTVLPPKGDLGERLDAWLGQHGAGSVLYVSFGSAFAPIHIPGQLEALLEVLLEGNRPFVLSQAAKVWPDDAQMPDLATRLELAHKEGRCYVSKWIPQTQLLAHKAVGAFLTHGGWNSAMEVIVHGVNAIYWPFIADQPLIALDQSLVRDTAWELLESRGEHGANNIPHRCLPPPTGLGLPTPLGTLDGLKAELKRVLLEESLPTSEIWKRKKANVLALADQMRKAWEPGFEGGAYTEVRKTIEQYTK